MAPPLGDPGRGRRARRRPRVPSCLRAPDPRPVPLHAGLPPGAPLRRGAPPLARDAARAGGRPLLPRPVRATRPHHPARPRRCAGGRRRARGPLPDRRLLLPAGSQLPTLDLRPLRRPEREPARGVAPRQPLPGGELSPATRARRRDERGGRRGGRDDPRATLARDGRRRGRGRRRPHCDHAAGCPGRGLARRAPRALRATSGRRGHHRLGPHVAGPAARRAQPTEGDACRARSRQRPRRASRQAHRHRAREDRIADDIPRRAHARSRHRGRRDGRPRAHERDQAALRPRVRRRAGRARRAGDAPGRARREEHLAGARALSPATGREGRRGVHDAQVPHHAGQCGAHHGTRDGE